MKLSLLRTNSIITFVASLIAISMILVLGVAPTSSQATPRTDVSAQDEPILDPCSNEVMADTRAYINNYTADRIASDQVKTGWDGSQDLINNQEAVHAITKAAMLPCNPAIDLNNPSNNPANVQTILSIMDTDLWSQIVIADKVGAGDGAGTPHPTGFDTPQESYESFLRVSARFPYFCGEKGVWSTVKEACQRELSTMFAHAIQETGEKPVPAGEELWQTSLYYTREMGCYPNNCTQYNVGAADFDAPNDVGFYGRGMKQLSYAYNYAAFSATYYGDMSVLINDPDLVATKADLILGSGIWFAMSPQPPKPAMHDVVTGLYTPDLSGSGGSLEGISTQQDGSVFNKFATTVSIINGGIECSPTEPTQIQQSKNRFINYKALLPVYGVTPQQETLNEDEMIPGTTLCEITKGNPFVQAPLAWSLPFYYDTGTPGQHNGTCWAVGYGQAVPLPISAPDMYTVCLAKYSDHPPSPEAPSTPGAPTATAGDQEVTLNWTAPNNGGSPITGYDVQRSTNPNSGFTDATGCTSLGNVHSCTATGLTNGTEYFFRVRARNQIGAGAFSLASEGVIPLPAPAVSGISPASGPLGGGTTINISGENFIGGATITVGGIACNQAEWLSAESMSCVTPAHSVGSTNVVVENPDGQTATAIGGFTYMSVPATPTGLSIQRSGAGDMRVNWNIGQAGLSPATSYQVQTSPGGRTCTASTARACVVTGLINGTAYKFRTRAINSMGSSGWSAWSKAGKPAGRSQAVRGKVAKKIKYRKKVKLPAKTNSGLKISWKSNVPKRCHISKGRVVQGKQIGKCRLTARVNGTTKYNPLAKNYSVSVVR